MNKIIEDLTEAKKLVLELNDKLYQANKKANPVEHMILMYLLEDVAQFSLRLQQFKNSVEEKEEKEEKVYEQC